VCLPQQDGPRPAVRGERHRWNYTRVLRSRQATGVVVTGHLGRGNRDAARPDRSAARSPSPASCCWGQGRSSSREEAASRATSTLGTWGIATSRPRPGAGTTTALPEPAVRRAAGGCAVTRTRADPVAGGRRRALGHPLPHAEDGLDRAGDPLQEGADLVEPRPDLRSHVEDDALGDGPGTFDDLVRAGRPLGAEATDRGLEALGGGGQRGEPGGDAGQPRLDVVQARRQPLQQRRRAADGEGQLLARLVRPLVGSSAARRSSRRASGSGWSAVLTNGSRSSARPASGACAA
jgi:hypothetical protein